MNKFVLILLALNECILVEPLLPSIAGRLGKVIFVYPTGAQSERDLNTCSENSACNVIYKRFWLPPLVERICKCSQRQECRWIWTEEPDNYTMTLDNRSQIKFCNELQLPKCTNKKPAIKIVTESLHKKNNTTSTAKFRNSFKTNRFTEPKNVTALCNCQGTHYWKLKINSTKHEEDTDRKQKTYFCSKLKKCVRSEFCGYVRIDTYSNFYRCSCPKGHLCITQDKTMFQIEEVLYNGFGYKAFCLPVKN